jgi:hypothetical protein
MIVLTSVSDDRSGRKGGLYQTTQQKIEKLFNYNKWFDRQVHWTIDNVFDTSFYYQHRKMLDEFDAAKNGRLYKPFIIQQELKRLKQGDFLLYTDCSPEMWNFSDNWQLGNIYGLDEIKRLCEANNDFLTGFVKWDDKQILAGQFGKHTHHWFTLDSCLEIMEAEQHRNSFQCASGMICIRKTVETEQTVEEWLHFNSIKECACMNVDETENKYWSGGPGYKLGNRHDQAILSVLLNKRNLNYCDILYNDISPYNLLNFCRKDVRYKFLNSNNPAAKL